MTRDSRQALKEGIEKLFSEHAMEIRHLDIASIPFQESILDEKTEAMHIVLLASKKPN